MLRGMPFCPASTAKACRSALGLQRHSSIPASRITDLTIFQALVRPHGQSRSGRSVPYAVSSGMNVRGTGTARKIRFFLCFSVSKTIASSAASIRASVNARTSEIRAPVNAIVRQNVEIARGSFEAAWAKAKRSLAVRYFRFPFASNNEPLMNGTKAAADKYCERYGLTSGILREQNTAFRSV